MPLFGRRVRTTSSAAPSQGERIGRKFSSQAGVERSIENFRAAVTQQLGAEPTFFDAEWSGPEPAPLRVIGLVEGAVPPLGQRAGVSYLAVWPDGRMYFVAPDYSTQPTPPLVGMWKMRDSTLTSVGSVASSEFGVVA